MPEVPTCMQEFVRRKHKNIPIEVETRTLDEVKEVLQFLETDRHSLVKRLMLDNMTKLDSSAPGTFWCMRFGMPPALSRWMSFLLQLPPAHKASAKFLLLRILFALLWIPLVAVV